MPCVLDHNHTAKHSTIPNVKTSPFYLNACYMLFIYIVMVMYLLSKVFIYLGVTDGIVVFDFPR